MEEKNKGMGERDDWTVYFRKDGGPLKTIHKPTTKEIIWAVENPDEFDEEFSVGSYDLKNEL